MYFDRFKMSPSTQRKQSDYKNYEKERRNRFETLVYVVFDREFIGFAGRSSNSIIYDDSTTQDFGLLCDFCSVARAPRSSLCSVKCMADAAKP